MVKRAQAYTTSDDLDERTTAWLADVRGSTRARPQLQLQPGRCALLVVDMLRYFVTPDGRAFLPAAAAIVPRIQRLLTAWRQRGGVVAFARHGHSGADDLGMMGRFYSDFIRADEPDAEIVSELLPRSGELVFRKSSYDAFFGTGLEAALSGAGITQLLVCGVLTHLCCETTARSAFVRGFEVYFPADATATSTEALHTASLRALADGFAVVMSVDEVIAQCAARS